MHKRVTTERTRTGEDGDPQPAARPPAAPVQLRFAFAEDDDPSLEDFPPDLRWMIRTYGD